MGNKEEVKSMTPIKRIETVKSQIPLKSVQEIEEIEELENLTPIDDDVAEKMLKKLGYDKEEGYEGASDYSLSSEETSYAGRLPDDRSYERSYEKEKESDVERVLRLLGISSFDQIKKVTPIKSIQEISSIRELSEAEVQRLTGEIEYEEVKEEAVYRQLDEDKKKIEKK